MMNDTGTQRRARTIEEFLELADLETLKHLHSLLRHYEGIIGARLRAPAAGCVYFERLPLSAAYGVGARFSESGATMTVQQFQWGNNVWTSNGFAMVENGGMARGNGQELEVNNVNIAFDFGGQVNAVKLLYGEYGGNMNIEINGYFQNFDNLPTIHGTNIGGVAVDVQSGNVPGGEQGTLTLRGPIRSFAIGGQELWIDEVCWE